MQQNKIHTDELTTQHQSALAFIANTRDMVVQHSHELHHTEIQDFIDRGNTKQLLLKLWEFIDCYALWPEALLGRTDLNGVLREALLHHLNQLKGLADRPSHTTLFQNLATSLNVSLPNSVSQGWLISSVVHSAENAPLSEALGKYFANECLASWPGLEKAMAGIPNISVDFFSQHHHSESFFEELSRDQNNLVFTDAAQAYAIQRTIFMNQIRALV